QYYGPTKISFISNQVTPAVGCSEPDQSKEWWYVCDVNGVLTSYLRSGAQALPLFSSPPAACKDNELNYPSNASFICIKENPYFSSILSCVSSLSSTPKSYERLLGSSTASLLQKPITYTSQSFTGNVIRRTYKPYNTTANLNITDWNDAQALFLAINLSDTKTFEIANITIKFSGSNQPTYYKENLTSLGNVDVNGLSLFMIPLSSFSSTSSTSVSFLGKAVKRIEVEVRKKVLDSLTNQKFTIHQMRLVYPQVPQSTNNNDRFCTRLYSQNTNSYYTSWIKDLDLPEGKEGCNALTHGNWTGTKCCGDDLPETFVDSNGACYASHSIKNDTVLSKNFKLLNATKFYKKGQLGPAYYLCNTTDFVVYQGSPSLTLPSGSYPVCTDANSATQFCKEKYNAYKGSPIQGTLTTQGECYQYVNNQWVLGTSSSLQQIACYVYTTTPKDFLSNMTKQGEPYLPLLELLQTQPSAISLQEQCAVVGNDVCFGNNDGWISLRQSSLPLVFRKLLTPSSSSGGQQLAVPLEDFKRASLPAAYTGVAHVSFSGCCPKNSCWNGRQCVQEFSLLGNDQASNTLTSCPKNTDLNTGLILGIEECSAYPSSFSPGYQEYTYVCMNGEWKDVQSMLRWNPTYTKGGFCPENTCFADKATFTFENILSDYDYDGVNDAVDKCYNSSFTIRKGSTLSNNADTKGCYIKSGQNVDVLQSLYQTGASATDGGYCVPNFYNPVYKTSNIKSQYLCMNQNWTTKNAFIATLFLDYIKKLPATLKPSDYTLLCEEKEIENSNVFFTSKRTGFLPTGGCVLTLNNNSMRLYGFGYDLSAQAGTQFYSQALTHFNLDFPENEKNTLTYANYFKEYVENQDAKFKYYNYSYFYLPETKLKPDSTPHLQNKVRYYINPALQLIIVSRHNTDAYTNSLNAHFNEHLNIRQQLSLVNLLKDPIKYILNLFSGANLFYKSIGTQAQSHILAQNNAHLLLASNFDRYYHAYYTKGTVKRNITLYHVPKYDTITDINKHNYLFIRYEGFGTNVFAPIDRYFSEALDKEAFEARPINDTANPNLIIGYQLILKKIDNIKITPPGSTLSIPLYLQIWNDLGPGLRITDKQPFARDDFFMIALEGFPVAGNTLTASAKLYDQEGKPISLAGKTCVWYIGIEPGNSGNCEGYSFSAPDTNFVMKVSYEQRQAVLPITLVDPSTVLLSLRLVPSDPLPASSITAQVVVADEQKLDRAKTKIHWYENSTKKTTRSLADGQVYPPLGTMFELEVGDSYSFVLDNIYYDNTNITSFIPLSKRTSPSVYVSPYRFTCTNSATECTQTQGIKILGYNASVGYVPSIKPTKNNLCCKLTSANPSQQQNLLGLITPCDANAQFKLYDKTSWKSVCFGLTGTAMAGNAITCTARNNYCTTDELCITAVDSDGNSAGACGQEGKKNLCCKLETQTQKIVPALLVPATVGQSYNQQITLSGVPLGQYTWSVTSGSLPSGLTLSPTTGYQVAITGTPTKKEQKVFTLKAAGNTIQIMRTYTITVHPAMGIIDTTLPEGIKHVPYTFTFTTIGMQQPVFSLEPGSTLPPGLSLSSQGTISGIPTQQGNYGFTVKVTSGQQTYTESFVIIINQEGTS
ncbi:MAG: Ig domain-containing protein, partial [Candidatus Woesearchaeota archaeon]